MILHKLQLKSLKLPITNYKGNVYNGWVRRQSILGLTIATICLSGCNPYTFVKIEESKDLKPGYHVLRRNVFIDELTSDENSNHSQDLSIAKQRLERRRKTVEEWYKRYYPDALQEHILITSVKAIILAPLFPLFLLTEGVDNPHLTEGQLERKLKEDRKAREEIMKYIEEDCRKEMNKM